MPATVRAEYKIVLYITFVIALYATGSFGTFGFLGACLLVLLPRVPFRRLKAGWPVISIFIVFTFISNVFGMPGRILWNISSAVITDAGLRVASIRALRLLYMIAGVKILMASASTEEIIDGLGRLLMPLDRLGLPMKDFFHSMGLTISCFPVLQQKLTDVYRQHRASTAGSRFSTKIGTLSEFLVRGFVQSVRDPSAFFEAGDGRER